MLVSKLSHSGLVEIQEILKTNLDKADSLEEAAQQFVETVYHYFSESVVLLRLFVTIPMAELPEEIRSFVRQLGQGAAVPVEETSYVLTLLGTAGAESQWNNRSDSEGHQGIPLATPDFVTSIPMMSALLEQLGFDLGWIRGEPDIVAQKMGSMSGTFYVPDAGSTRDSKNRLIIAAQDFVRKYRIQTVFGVGGGYITTDKFLTTIFFLREFTDKKTAISFQVLVNVFKFKTQKFIGDKRKYF